MKSAKNMFLKKWVAGNIAVYSGALGLLHPLIAHGLTGDHDRLLTTPQFIMHTLSLFVFVYVLVRMQRSTLQVVGKREAPAGIWPFLFVAPWVFWLGYYTLFVPFDILFMFLSIGMINALQLRPMVKAPAKWMWQCLLGYLLAAVAGIVVGLGGYLLYYKQLPGIARDIATWISISLPAGLVVAYYFRYIWSVQLLFPGEEVPGTIPGQKMPFPKVA